VLCKPDIEKQALVNPHRSLEESLVQITEMPYKGCPECRRLMDEYRKTLDGYDRAMQDLRETATTGQDTQPIRQHVDLQKKDVRDARIAYQIHSKAHDVTSSG